MKMTFRLIRGSCIILFLSLMSLPERCVAETDGVFAIGVPVIPQSLQVLRSDSPEAVIVRNAVSQGLLILEESKENPVSGVRPKFSLGLADNLSVSADYKMWSLRIRGGVEFWNGRPVALPDVLYSLRRCIADGQLHGVREVRGRTAGPGTMVPGDWIDMELEDSASTEKATSVFPRELALCPVLEMRSSTLFGRDNGIGTNIVGAGPYQIVDFDPGRFISMQRAPGQTRFKEGARQIDVRAYTEPRQGLTALRLGNLDLLLTDSPEVLALVAADATLDTMKCADIQVAVRRGVTFSCNPVFNVANLSYVE